MVIGKGVIGRRPEMLRKLLHLAVSAIPVLYANGFGREALLATLGALSMVALAVEMARRTYPGLNSAFSRAVGTLLRDRERSALTGASWLFLAGFASILLLDRRPAIAALWCVTAGDPAATLVGRGFSRLRARPWVPGKTLEGSVACAITSFLGVWLLAGYGPLSAAAVATAAAIAERFTGRLDDNATVTAAAGLLATLLA